MHQLTHDEKAILDFEAQHWTYPAAKETAMVERFGMLAPRYYQALNGLLGRPEAHAHRATAAADLQMSAR